MQASNHRPLILVVDDDQAIRLLLEDELSSEGYRVAVASNGDEAMALLTDSLPDLVTLDIKMPGKDGLEILREIKARHPDLPVVMLTAYSSFQHDHDAELADAYEVKSADLTSLKETVRRLLNPPTS